jgi:Flp pilus assembly protein TadG
MIVRVADFGIRLQKLCRSLIDDKAGNIAMSFAIVSIPLLGAMGAGFDYMRAMNMHREIQGNLDAALVAAVKDVGTKDANAVKEQLANWLAAEADGSGEYFLDPTSVVIDTSNSGLSATVRADVETTFMRILGKTSVPVSVNASVLGGQDKTTKNAFSMYLVLDRSGSMSDPTTSTYTTTCYKNDSKKTPYQCTQKYTKMEALKLASASLLAQFDEADPETKYVRTGAVSYDNITDTPSPLAWGTTSALNYVNALTPRNTTNSGGATELAYNALMATGSKNEDKIHEAKSGVKKPSRYIVLMTDGENNVSNADTKTKQYCDKARADKIEVYSIAFMAPSAGQKLLKYCATTSGHYFSADNTAELVEAFKLIGQTAAKTLVRLTN